MKITLLLCYSIIRLFWIVVNPPYACTLWLIASWSMMVVVSRQCYSSLFVVVPCGLQTIVIRWQSAVLSQRIRLSGPHICVCVCLLLCRICCVVCFFLGFPENEFQKNKKRIIITLQKSINILLMVVVVGTTGDGLALGNPWAVAWWSHDHRVLHARDREL